MPVTCANLLNANIGQGQICSNKLSTAVVDVTIVPWKIGGAKSGLRILPPGMSISASTSVSAASLANPSYYCDPEFLHFRFGPVGDPNIPGEIYQVDAVAYGGTSSTAAVVESTYAVYTSSSNRTL